MKQIIIDEVNSLTATEKSILINAVRKVYEESPFEALTIYMEGDLVITTLHKFESVVINEIFCARNWLLELLYA
jgi:hypothetical protein